MRSQKERNKIGVYPNFGSTPIDVSIGDIGSFTLPVDVTAVANQLRDRYGSTTSEDVDQYSDIGQLLKFPSSSFMVFVVDGADTVVDCFGDVAIDGRSIVGMTLGDLEGCLGLPDSGETDCVGSDPEWVLTTCSWTALRIRCYVENGRVDQVSFEDHSR